MSSSENQCKQCYVGRYRESDMPYLCWMDEREVMVPDVPGFQCDICGDSFYNPEFIQHLAASGCRMLQLGLESGSQVVLDRLGKGIRLEAASKILDNLSVAGITSYVYIMLGTPGETEADAEMTLKFLEEHAEKIGFLNISIMNLPRGSELLENPDLCGIDSSQLRDAESPLGLYHEFQSATGLDRAAARKFLNQRLLGSPVIREIVKRNPPIFSSNHAFFFGSG